jgi:2-keto-4-pentenoate hydratase/2-oxohepta-3-ene-1,7-dioic acid hydratase in catechol pathway
MKIASFRHDGLEGVGLISADEQSLQPLDAPLGLLALIEAASHGAPMPRATGAPLLLSAVQLLAPIPWPRRNLFCVGRNYHAHAKELSDSVFKANSSEVAGWPIVFTKVPECVVGPYDPIHLPGEVSTQIDYEAELAVIIGHGGKNISREQAMAHVWGYTIVNDVTARDVQMRHGQWDLGKSFDSFCPMGPWAVTADAFDGLDARVRCWVNGVLRQDGESRQMIFDIPSLIETCSRGITLFPGDIIATGTPAGVGMGMTPPSYLRSGDVVRIEIDNLGMIEITVRD